METKQLSGWLCPKCGRGNSPYSATCPCGPDVTYTAGTTTNTKIQIHYDDDVEEMIEWERK